jgi:hypothetical protein
VSVVASRKDLIQIVNVAKGQDWTIAPTRKGHLRFIPPDGGPYVITGSTPSCTRGLLNLRADLRRAGLETDPRRKKRA